MRVGRCFAAIQTRLAFAKSPGRAEEHQESHRHRKSGRRLAQHLLRVAGSGCTHGEERATRLVQSARHPHKRLQSLVADKLNSRATPRKYKYQPKQAEKQVQTLTVEAEKLHLCVSQLIDTNCDLGIQVPTLQNDLTQAHGQIADLEQELEPLPRRAMYQVPNGKLKLRHVPSQNKVLWASTESLPNHLPVVRGGLEQSWTAVSTALKTQQQEFLKDWDALAQQVEGDPTFDTYAAAMYACMKQARDQIGLVMQREVAPFVPGV